MRIFDLLKKLEEEATIDYSSNDCFKLLCQGEIIFINCKFEVAFQLSKLKEAYNSGKIRNGINPYEWMFTKNRCNEYSCNVTKPTKKTYTMLEMLGMHDDWKVLMLPNASYGDYNASKIISTLDAIMYYELMEF